MSLLLGKKVKLFSLSSNHKLAEEISEALGVPLADCVVKRFADGEVNININETVRGHHVFVVQPTNNPVNENFCPVLKTFLSVKFSLWPKAPSLQTIWTSPHFNLSAPKIFSSDFEGFCMTESSIVVSGKV